MKQESLQKCETISILTKLNVKLKSENYGREAPKGTNHYSFEIALMEAIQSHTECYPFEMASNTVLPRPDTTVLKQVLEENTDMDSDLKGALNSIIQDSLAPHINASKEKKRDAELYFEIMHIINSLYGQYEFMCHERCFHPEFALHYKCMFTYPSETEHILDCILKELSEDVDGEANT